MYDDWRGVVYPESLPKREWFRHYATLFDTVELNSTFYRLPSPATVERWAALAPPGFEFALKLGAFGSHRMKLRDAASWLPNHVDRAARLGPALGPTVVQLPPRWRRATDRLDEFLHAAPTTMRWAVEIREPSWLHEETYEVLRRHDAALVLHDLVADHPVVLTASWAYVRFHGPDARNRRYHGSYSKERLEHWAHRIGAWSANGIDVYAYFNNDYHGHAVRNATDLIRLTAAAGDSHHR
jgi:uncharacterized protein YecE (DUF72 family)